MCTFNHYISILNLLICIRDTVAAEDATPAALLIFSWMACKNVSIKCMNWQLINSQLPKIERKTNISASMQLIYWFVQGAYHTKIFIATHTKCNRLTNTFKLLTSVHSSIVDRLNALDRAIFAWKTIFNW